MEMREVEWRSNLSINLSILSINLEEIGKGMERQGVLGAGTRGI